jgi:hypothetical protein
MRHTSGFVAASIVSGLTRFVAAHPAMSAHASSDPIIFMANASFFFSKVRRAEQADVRGPAYTLKRSSV